VGHIPPLILKDIGHVCSLVVQQVNKEWDVNKDTMDTYVVEIRKLENMFSRLEIHLVIRDSNVGADVLSKLHLFLGLIISPGYTC
jgi:hypothetical protein